MARKPGTTPKAAARRPAKSKDAAGDAGGVTTAESGTSGWEWAAAGVGAAILAGVLGFLVYEGVSKPGGAKPAIVVAGDTPVRLETGAFLVPIRVANEGHTTGANVTVRGELRDPDGVVVEESTATFDFIAQHSEETGGLYFSVDPATLGLALRVEGYTDP
jgi:uncharacterized protein (TIGR02588 family)